MAEEREGGVIVFALSGAFAMPGRPLEFLQAGPREQHSPDDEGVRQAFEIAGERRFDHDPRFSLVVRSEIAGRALSPAVNDPGTAIDIVGTLVRLFVLWNDTPRANPSPNTTAWKFLKFRSMICSTMPLPRSAEMGRGRSRSLCGRAESKMDLVDDLLAVRNAARFSQA